MHRPTSGPLWPPTDDTVENSLRRAYLRAPPRPPTDQTVRDRFQDLLDDLAEVLKHPEFRRTSPRQQGFRQSA